MERLLIILEAPLWPSRDKLSNAGCALFDAMVLDAKEFATNVANGDFDPAFQIAGRWGEKANAFIEATLINDPENPVATEANTRLLDVFKYYTDKLCAWNEITSHGKLNSAGAALP